MKKWTGPKVGLFFMRNNSVVISPHFTMQIKTASSETNTRPQPVITDDALTIPPTTSETITPFVDYPSKWNTTGTVTPLEKFTETASLLISHSISRIFDKRVAVRVTTTTESPYLIKKHTQIAEFSVVTPEQSKHIKPADMAILSTIPQGDPDLTAYLSELLRTNKPEQQNNTFWFPTPENPGKPEDYTPIQTRILKELKIQRHAKTQPTREQRILIQISQTIWLDQHTSNRNRETSNWRYSAWPPWHFRQTQNGYWDEHGVQGEINTQRR